MTEGTSQGLYLTVAIVIFGIFVGLSYLVFGDTLQPKLVGLFEQATEQAGYIDDEAGKDSGGLIVEGVKYKDYSDYYNTFTPNAETDFEFDASKGLITNYIGTKKDVVIPNKIKGVTVKSIGGTSTLGAFYSKGLTRVILPDTLEEIVNSSANAGSGSFRENKLTEIVIPDTVKNIGFYAFYENKLTKVALPKTLNSIQMSTFQRNNLTELDLPDSIVSVASNAFEDNEITKVSWSKNLKTIGNEAFLDNNIEELTLPDSITTIGKAAFKNNLINKLTLSSSLVNIEYDTFNNNKLTEIIIPTNIKTVGGLAFAENNITKINYTSNALDSVGSNSFLGNPIVNTKVTHPIYFKFDKNQGSITQYIGYGGEVVIPDTIDGVPVTKISGYDTSGAFFRKGLTSVTLPTTLEEIINVGGNAGSGSFYENNLTELVIPESVKHIGFYTFYGNKLSSVSIPKTLTKIDNGAFKSNKLTNVDLGLDTKLGTDVFDSVVKINFTK